MHTSLFFFFPSKDTTIIICLCYFSLGFLLLSISFDIYKCTLNKYTYIFFLILVKTDGRIDKFRRGLRYKKISRYERQVCGSMFERMYGNV